MTDRVLEIGGYGAAYAGRLFARAGNSVLRLEQPDLPAYASPAAMDAYLHAGKHRCFGASAQQLAELAAQADVVICEAGCADEIDELGFDHWTTPVKIAITPFGRTGPKCNWRATPNTLLAMGGYTYIVGDADRAPLTIPGHYVEFQSGALAYLAAVACQVGGDSDVGEVSHLETVMSLSQFTTVRWHCAGEIRERHGSDFWFVVPSELFHCADGWVYINIIPTFWDAFTVFIDHPEWLLDERFADNDLRMANREELHRLVATQLEGQPVQEVDERARRCRIPLGVVQSFDDVLTDVHLRERNFWESVQLIDGTELRLPGTPLAEPTPVWSVQAPVDLEQLEW